MNRQRTKYTIQMQKVLTYSAEVEDLKYCSARRMGIKESLRVISWMGRNKVNFYRTASHPRMIQQRERVRAAKLPNGEAEKCGAQF